MASNNQQQQPGIHEQGQSQQTIMAGLGNLLSDPQLQKALMYSAAALTAPMDDGETHASRFFKAMTVGQTAYDMMGQNMAEAKQRDVTDARAALLSQDNHNTSVSNIANTKSMIEQRANQEARAAQLFVPQLKLAETQAEFAPQQAQATLDSTIAGTKLTKGQTANTSKTGELIEAQTGESKARTANTKAQTAEQKLRNLQTMSNGGQPEPQVEGQIGSYAVAIKKANPQMSEQEVYQMALQKMGESKTNIAAMAQRAVAEDFSSDPYEVKYARAYKAIEAMQQSEGAPQGQSAEQPQATPSATPTPAPAKTDPKKAAAMAREATNAAFESMNLNPTQRKALADQASQVAATLKPGQTVNLKVTINGRVVVAQVDAQGNVRTAN